MGHGLRRAAAQRRANSYDDDWASRTEAKGWKRNNIKKRHGKQPCGFPDVTDWIDKHPGHTEWACEFCGIYKASKPRCNHCQKDS